MKAAVRVADERGHQLQQLVSGLDSLPELFTWEPDRHRRLLQEPVVTDCDVRSA